MSDQLLRDQRSIKGLLFVAAPYEVKSLSNGSTFNFDEFYSEELLPAAEECGMKAVRADGIYGPQSVMEPIWRGLQQAEVVLVDFTSKAPNVAFEYALALLIGKPMIYLTQDPDDIPSDVRGRLRYIKYSPNFADVKRMRRELALQLDAIRKESHTEMAIVPMTTGGTEPAPTRVISVQQDFLVVETRDKRRAVLGNADVDYHRIVPDMSRRFKVGDELDGAFEMDATTGATRYTLLAGKENPWPGLAAAYKPGTTFPSVVHSVLDGIGAFIKVTDGVNGLVPRDNVPSGVRLQPGMEVRVTVVKVDGDQRRVSLRLEGVTSEVSELKPSLPRLGQQLEGEVVRVKPEGEGGFILVKMEGYEQPALLHCTQMSPMLREDLNALEVEVGEFLAVEVTKVDRIKNRVLVRDIPEEQSEVVTAA